MSWQRNHTLGKRSWDRIPRGEKKNLASGTFCPDSTTREAFVPEDVSRFCPGSATRDKNLEAFVPEALSRFQNRDKKGVGNRDNKPFV